MHPTHPRLEPLDGYQVGMSRVCSSMGDEPDVRSTLEAHMKKLGCSSSSTGSAHKALVLLKRTPVDIVLAGIRMRKVDGTRVLGKINDDYPEISDIVLTHNHDLDGAAAALTSGAEDYIIKPLNLSLVTHSVRRPLEKRTLLQMIRQHHVSPDKMAEGRTDCGKSLFLVAIQTLVAALEEKDRCSDGHSKRVAWLSRRLGEAIGLPARELEVVQVAGIVHDLGKIGIRESVLSKPGPLSTEEYDHIKSHCDIGARILEPLQELRKVIPLVRHHQERWDGKGYPLGLRGSEIPLGARILAVADTFDVMTSVRPYRAALPVGQAVSQMQEVSGSQLDPSLVKPFVKLAIRECFLQQLYSPLPKFPQVDALAGALA